MLNRPGGPGQFGEEGLQRVAQEAADLGVGRIVVSEIEVQNLFVNPV